MLSIIPARKSHLPELAHVYKSSYKKHNIFSGSIGDIARYLEKVHASERLKFGGFTVALVEDKDYKNKVVGGVLVRRKLESKSHERWHISHLAVDPNHQDKGYATDIVQGIIMDAQRMIESSPLKSIKIEVHTVTKAGIRLFSLNGFSKEGLLKDHYRLGEECVALGLTIK